MSDLLSNLALIQFLQLKFKCSKFKKNFELSISDLIPSSEMLLAILKQRNTI